MFYERLELYTCSCKFSSTVHIQHVKLLNQNPTFGNLCHKTNKVFLNYYNK